MNNLERIDFVVTWVNGNDERWISKKGKYLKQIRPVQSMNSNSRYRDFDIFQYWFKGVERYASWVNKIYLITDEQVPHWLSNMNNEKIICLNHEDFIPKEYLPTFNSNVIELNLHRIEELSDRFVLFNDDMFINDFVQPTDFFKDGKPVDLYAESPIISTSGSVANTMVNNMEVINQNFSKKEFYTNNFRKIFNLRLGSKLFRTLALLPSKNFSGMWNNHLPVPYCKDIFTKIWNVIPEELNQSCLHKFRTKSDYSHWLMRYWQLASGNFELQKNNFGQVYELGTVSNESVKDEIIQGRHKTICLNDNDNVKDFDELQKVLRESFESKYIIPKLF
ncbi:hypothetical protein ABM34_07490 [Companilactobacillus ginsenosidimutans]|uniref:Capsule biosynthesis protein CapG n=1 Tax=Companilactobacillus ginsenosidimutans TaxID=1007676 RepID=A0A0H4QNT1_9LACO|nr:hypothetical protein ABM34_07490 [Companilactobacillus ginsenosidimutans]